MEGEDTRPSFCNIMLSLPHLEDQLEIPPHFVNEHLASKSREMVTLKGSCGSMNARLQYGSSGTYIVNGWRDFADTHCIEEGDLALFFYNGVNSFDVTIYTAKGCLRNPSFKHKMTKSNVGSSCMLIPKAFARMHLPNSKHEIFFEDSKGISWLINVIIDCRGCYYMSAGWKDFADARKIKEGDVCVFELVEPNLMHVTIRRS